MCQEKQKQKNKDKKRKDYKKLEEKIDDMSRQLETLKTNPPTTITINSSTNVNDNSTKIQANNNNNNNNNTQLCKYFIHNKGYG
jgi:hypothetical protein